MNTCCVCGRFTYNENDHCTYCWHLYAQGYIQIQGQWWKVETKGVMDFFALPALHWNQVRKVRHRV